MLLVLACSGCGASVQTKVGAVLAFAGVAGVTAGATLATSHCEPAPDFCRSTAAARPDEAS